jgi:ribonuclease-3
VPDYVVSAISGEAHAQTFTIECRVPALAVVATGTGTSRRAAEQDAAAQAFPLAVAATGGAHGG